MLMRTTYMQLQTHGNNVTVYVCTDQFADQSLLVVIISTPARRGANADLQPRCRLPCHAHVLEIAKPRSLDGGAVRLVLCCGGA